MLTSLVSGNTIAQHVTESTGRLIVLLPMYEGALPEVQLYDTIPIGLLLPRMSLRHDKPCLLQDRDKTAM